MSMSLIMMILQQSLLLSSKQILHLYFFIPLLELNFILWQFE